MQSRVIPACPSTKDPLHNLKFKLLFLYTYINKERIFFFSPNLSMDYNY